eukprot:scaffold12503_cov143-Cylindrotheca_fusiformis.AAC.2
MKHFSTIVFAASLIATTSGYTPLSVTTRRSTMTMKRGRGSFKREIDGGSDSSGSVGVGPSRNWINTKKKVDMLPKEDGSVALLDTGAFLLVDKATNPTGAVCVMKYGSQTHCFSSSCPQCKIPMTKAKALPPNAETGTAPRVACDFCKATYNLKTGEKVASEEKTGFLGGIAKAVLSAQEGGPLPIYQLGEKNGEILFSMD